MKKRLIALLMTFTILASLLSVSAAASSDTALRNKITAEFDAYVSSVAKNSNYNAAATQMLRHSLNHGNEFLELGEQDALTASMLSSNLFRAYVIDALTTGIQQMQRKGTEEILIGSTVLGWHDYAYTYNVAQWHNNKDPQNDPHSHFLIEHVDYTEPINQNDKTMVLLVGSAGTHMRITQTDADTYRVQLEVYDSFDFNADYSEESDLGWDTTNSVLISMIGTKYLNPFDWNMSLTFDIALSDSPFTDVNKSDWFYAPVLWAVENKVTSGKTATTFAPYEGCTRAQVVTFLWAANGKPAPAAANNPFTDISESDWYYNAVLWAVENKITGGTSATTFGPYDTCTRAQIGTFLWAANGKPAVQELSGFSDVTEFDWFATPVIWAKEQNITTGIGNGMFAPYNTCTRAEVVTFLYKVYG